MGTELAPVKKFLQEEELKYKAAVSSAVGFKIGKMLNFLGRRTHEVKSFFLNGPYFIGADPQTYVDGLAVFEFDSEIFNVWMFNVTPGTSGTTELDLQIAASPGAGYASIFTTTPKITSAAAGGSWVGVGGAVGGCVAPILAPNAGLITAGTAIRIDKLQSMPDAENTGLIVHFRPR